MALNAVWMYLIGLPWRVVGRGGGVGGVIVVRGRSARELAELAILMGVEPEEAVEILVREALERQWRLRLFLETLREAGEAVRMTRSGLTRYSMGMLLDSPRYGRGVCGLQ